MRTTTMVWLMSTVLGTTLAQAGCVENGEPIAAAQLDELQVSVRQPILSVVPTLSRAGDIDHANPFFRSLGTNGRSCATCHDLADAMTITPEHVRERFERTGGTDPLFRTVDGANSPDADVSSVAARRRAYSMLLEKGLIRVELPIPDGAEFDLVDVDDPYHHASARGLSLFRRPLPATNLRFLSAVMWDGRETLSPTDLALDLGHQANDATRGHAQALADLTEAERAQIVAFETSLFTASVFNSEAGWLTAGDAQGGPRNLVDQPFYLGINDVLGGDPQGLPFSPQVFDLFDGWARAQRRDDDGDGDDDARHERSRFAAGRAAVARGQALFNRKPIRIRGVKGLNDALGTVEIAGTCTTCHDTPNVGDHSVSLPIDIGVSDGARRTPDLPLYTLRRRATGETLQTTDPARALITGKWSDIGKTKGPMLRGLAARAPYFHNGSAATLESVVEFYDGRFDIGFTAAEKADLVAFLRAL